MEPDHSDFSEEDVPERSGTYCSLASCPHQLPPAAQGAWRRLCEAFVWFASKQAPRDTDFCVEPLVIQALAANGLVRYVLVGFLTRKSPVETIVCLLQETSLRPSPEAFPFDLELPRDGSFMTHKSLCRQLVMNCLDWSLAELKVGDVEVLYKFHIVGAGTAYEISELLLQKQDRGRGDQAWRLANQLLRGPAPERPKKKRRKKGGRRQPIAEVLEFVEEARDEQSWHAESSGAESSRSTAHDEGPQGEQAPAPAEPPQPEHGPLLPRQRRGEPWGIWQLAPIFARGVHTAWGAVCGRHTDDVIKTECKKTCAFRGGRYQVTEAEAKLRLKRWLVAGMDDRDWAPDTGRRRHVGMGGPGLVEFACGLSEPELDECARQLVQDH